MLLQDMAAEKIWLGGCFFEELQTYMKKKIQGNENKIIIGDFNCILDKMGGNKGNKRQKTL